MPYDSLPPLSLYVHLPWCVRKCPYCDFNSYRAPTDVPEEAYVDALLRDLDAELPLAADRPIESIFIGGGTPSLFSSRAIARLLREVRARIDVAPGAEITLEANPGAADAERFAAFREAGVNRLSIGVQSFRDPQLRALGRVHGGAEAIRAARAARAAGFDNVNLDLMYGLPGDDPAAALADLEAAVDLEPAHLSWYQLSIEPGTAFYRHPPRLPDEDAVVAIEERGRAFLARRGYERYEISAHARPGFRCAHNLAYWRFDDYLGIGAGAHGKLTLPAEGAVERRAKTRNPRTYIETAGTAAAVSTERVEAPRQLVLEFMMNALRLVGGVDVARFETRTGRSAREIEPARAEAVRRGWLVADSSRLEATAAGLAVLNRVLALF
ncbi:MAG TPA: radical SAM family heme chaperone HemW [Gammaproteobacteria bacterium]